MPSMPSKQVLTGLSSTNGFPIWFSDVAIRPFSVSVSAATNSSNANYSVEVSNDYTGSSTFISTAATWFSSILSAATTNAFVSIGFPVTAVRINSTGGSSTGVITATFVQAG